MKNLNKLSNMELNKLLWQDFILPKTQIKIRKILDKKFMERIKQNDMIEQNNTDQDVVWEQENNYEEEILS